MANRNVFTSYKRLEEALESIMADESNDEEYDMVLVPPDPAVVSDEEEGNEDNLASSRFPMDVPGTIEVGRRHPDYDVSELSDSDDEQLRPIPANAKMYIYLYGGKLSQPIVLLMKLPISYKRDKNTLLKA